eukprot:7283367-Pyramimonas_sp.AAC.1
MKACAEKPPVVGRAGEPARGAEKCTAQDPSPLARPPRGGVPRSGSDQESYALAGARCRRLLAL